MSDQEDRFKCIDKMSFDEVKRLLEEGADAVNNKKQQPLYDAVVMCKNYEIVKLLLENGADKTIDSEWATRDDVAYNVLSIATERLCDPKLIELLIEFGADPEWAEQGIPFYSGSDLISLFSYKVRDYVINLREHDLRDSDYDRLTPEQAQRLFEIIKVYIDSGQLSIFVLAEIHVVLLDYDQSEYNIERLYEVMDYFLTYNNMYVLMTETKKLKQGEYESLSNMKFKRRSREKELKEIIHNLLEYLYGNDGDDKVSEGPSSPSLPSLQKLSTVTIIENFVDVSILPSIMYDKNSILKEFLSYIH